MASDTTTPPVSPTPTSLASDPVGHWIGGELVAPGESRRGEVFDPATGRVQRHVLLADAATVDRAVQTAKAAFPAWRDVPLSRKMPMLHRFRALLVGATDELVATLGAEHGKVPDDAAGEITRGLEMVDLALSAPEMLKGGFSEQVAGGLDTYSIRQPLGVCAGITPFNFPAMVPLWMFPVALACGNTFVLKPSDRDPSASLILARIVQEAGIPDGVFNVVQGDKEAVETLLDHPDVQAVSFVGSTAVAKEIYRRGAAAGKRVQALGGAKNHMIVMPDADVGQAADAAVSAAFGSTGQRCMAVSIAVAVGPVADEFAEAVAQRARALRIGPAASTGADMGPLVTAQARDKVVDYTRRGIEAGATQVPTTDDVPEDGFFAPPTVFDNVAPGMDIYEEEVFGPLLGIVRVDSLDQGLELIRQNRYGNGAAIFTRSGGAARKFQREVEAGMVGINVPIPVPVGYYSFGGWGDSLFGDSHIYGPEGFHFYTRGKVVTSRWPDDEPTGVNLAFPNG